MSRLAEDFSYSHFDYSLSFHDGLEVNASLVRA